MDSPLILSDHNISIAKLSYAFGNGKPSWKVASYNMYPQYRELYSLIWSTEDLYDAWKEPNFESSFKDEVVGAKSVGEIVKLVELEDDKFSKDILNRLDTHRVITVLLATQYTKASNLMKYLYKNSPEALKIITDMQLSRLNRLKQSGWDKGQVEFWTTKEFMKTLPEGCQRCFACISRNQKKSDFDRMTTIQIAKCWKHGYHPSCCWDIAQPRYQCPCLNVEKRPHEGGDGENPKRVKFVN